jgi:hypothetical protein
VTQKEQSSARGEMRRRHEAIIRSGALGKIRSEGRLVFALALCWADYKTCVFRISARGAAKTAGVQPTAIRRGLAQLIACGVIAAGPCEPGKRQKYKFITPQKSAHEPCAGGTHSVCAPRAHTVSTPDTVGARDAHTPCPERAQGVSGARTGCAPYSSIVLKGSSRTREDGRTVPDGPAVQSEAGNTESAKLRAEGAA